mgnify:CR=1 FL=1
MPFKIDGEQIMCYYWFKDNKGGMNMDDKKYTLPTPVVDRKEVELLEVLTKRYEAMTQPSTISK